MTVSATRSVLHSVCHAIRPRRYSLASVVAIGCALPFVLSAAFHHSAFQMEVVAALVAGIVGAMSALLWFDMSEGLALHAALARMTIGGFAAAAVLFVLPLGVLLVCMAMTGLRITQEEFLVSWLAVEVVVAPAAVAFVTGRYRPGRRASVVEAVAIIWGTLAWVVFARQLVVVSLLVGLGPVSIPEALWGFPFRELRPDQVRVGVLLLTAIPAVGFIGLRLQRWAGRRIATLICDGLFGVALLAGAYRLPAVLAFIALLVLDTIGRSNLSRRWVWVIIVVLSVLPFDISLQKGALAEPGLVPIVKGDFSTLDAFQHGPRYGHVVLDTGSHQTLYYEPRWVWVW